MPRYDRVMNGAPGTRLAETERRFELRSKEPTLARFAVEDGAPDLCAAAYAAVVSPFIFSAISWAMSASIVGCSMPSITMLSW